jgi:hypothetical protein
LDSFGYLTLQAVISQSFCLLGILGIGLYKPNKSQKYICFRLLSYVLTAGGNYKNDAGK